jgi:hypothetical protein
MSIVVTLRKKSGVPVNRPPGVLTGANAISGGGLMPGGPPVQPAIRRRQASGSGQQTKAIKPR